MGCKHKLKNTYKKGVIKINKYIKNKKKDNLLVKKLFPKQDLLFMKKYPKLYPVCKVHKITKNQIDYIFRRTNKTRLLCNINEQEFELTLRLFIINKYKGEGKLCH